MKYSYFSLSSAVVFLICVSESSLATPVVRSIGETFVPNSKFLDQQSNRLQVVVPLDAFPSDGVVVGFRTYLVAPTVPVRMQLWRPVSSDNFTLLYEAIIDSSSSYEFVTVYLEALNAGCARVQTSDVIGVYMEQSNPPISYKFNASSPSSWTNLPRPPRPGEFVHIADPRPYKFSLAALYVKYDELRSSLKDGECPDISTTDGRPSSSDSTSARVMGRTEPSSSLRAGSVNDPDPESRNTAQTMNGFYAWMSILTILVVVVLILLAVLLLRRRNKSSSSAAAAAVSDRKLNGVTDRTQEVNAYENPSMPFPGCSSTDDDYDRLRCGYDGLREETESQFSVDALYMPPSSELEVSSASDSHPTTPAVARTQSTSRYEYFAGPGRPGHVTTQTPQGIPVMTSSDTPEPVKEAVIY